MKLKKYWALPATILVCALVGGVLGPRISIAAAASEDDVKDSFRRFSQVLSIVEQNFVDEIEPESAVYQGAIPRMLQALDPHSSFFDPESFARMNGNGHYQRHRTRHKSLRTVYPRSGHFDRSPRIRVRKPRQEPIAMPVSGKGDPGFRRFMSAGWKESKSRLQTTDGTDKH